MTRRSGILEGEGETRSSIEPAGRPFPTRRFVFSGKNDEPIPDFDLPSNPPSREALRSLARLTASSVRIKTGGPAGLNESFREFLKHLTSIGRNQSNPT